MAKLTLEEKRLKALKLQLFGKEKHPTKSVPEVKLQKTEDLPPQTIASSVSKTLANPIFIKSDLFKIFFLTTLALIFQFSLYYLIQRNLINLNFLVPSF